MTHNIIEISIRGKWIRVPALDVDEKKIVIRGGWIKKAVIWDEEWLESEVKDPELCTRILKEHESDGLHADIFTFTQKLPATVPKYSYPMEWDSVAAIRLTNFKEWWEKLPQESRKNVRRSQKRGVIVKVRKLEDDLIGGLVELNNETPVRQGRRFVHYGKTFDQVRKDQSTFLDRSDFVCA